MTTLSVFSMSVRYGSVVAVTEASIESSTGTVTAIVGPNGAGKSSLLLATIGAIKAAEGVVRLNGEDIAALDANARTRGGLILVPQGRQVFSHLTVRENLCVVADSMSLSHDKVEEALDRFPILRERQRMPGGVLSGGEQQMLALARAIMGEPKVLLLDEPLLGLAPQVIEVVLQTLHDLAEAGVAIVVAEPSIRLIRAQITRGYVLLRGRVAATASSADELAETYKRCMGM